MTNNKNQVSRKNQITPMQYILLIHGTQMGVGVLVLPRDLVIGASTDGWIVLLITWFITTIAGLIIVQVMKKHPNGTLIGLITQYFGKWIGKLCTIIFALYFLLLAHVIFIREALFIRAWILPRTDIYLLIILLSIPSYLIVRHNISILARYSEFVFFITVWTLIILLMPLKYAEWLNLLPILKEGWEPIVSTVKSTFFSFIGIELAFFLHPFLQKKEKASSGIVIANSLTLFAALVVTITSFVVFSPEEIIIFSEPTLEMLKVIEFEFLERLEIVFFSVYLFVISTTVLPYMFMTVFCTSRLVGKDSHHKHLAWLLIIEIIVVVLFPPTFDASAMLQRFVEVAWWIFTLLFPILLWVYLSLHGLIKGRKMS